jgi:uroporphyrinogen decarboxylase
MTPKQIVIDQIRHRETPVIPYSLAFEGDVADRLDRHYGSQAWREKASPFILHVASVDTDRKFRIDAAFVRDPYGSVWRTDRRPWHLERPALSEPTLDGYAFPKPEEFLVSPEKKAEALAACARHADRFLVGSCGWGLFERSWTLRGYENALMDAVAEPEFYAALLDRLTDLYLVFVRETASLPVDAILFGDDWGDQRGVTMGGERWRRFLKPRWARLFAATHAAGKIAMCHSCGSVAAIVPDLIEIGLDVLESCQPEADGMNPGDLKRRFGKRIAFWGGLGTQSLIPFGKPDQIRTEVRRLAREMSRGGGYIMAPAKPLQPETPTANAAAVFEALAEAGGQQPPEAAASKSRAPACLS